MQRSFYLGDFNGTLFAFCEMVLRMDKPLAFSKPFPPEEEEELRQSAEENTERFGLRYYLEKDLMLTRLFASVDMENQWVYIVYREEEALERYFELKRREAELVASGAYTEEKQLELARDYGKLMGYSRRGIADTLERQ